jgi:hypothetical protein
MAAIRDAMNADVSGVEDIVKEGANSSAEAALHFFPLFFIRKKEGLFSFSFFFCSESFLLYIDGSPSSSSTLYREWIISSCFLL